MDLPSERQTTAFAQVGRVTPCAPWLAVEGNGAHGVTRPAMRTVVKPFGFFFYVMVLFCLSGFAAEPPVSCVLRLRG